MAGEPLETTPEPQDSTALSETFVNPPTYTDVATSDIYSFLQQQLRDIDEKDGTSFLKRFLKRPGELFARIQQKVWRLTLVNDVEKVPEGMLDFLLADVGFGEGSGRAWEVARRLTADQKRKLLKVAVPYWKKRGRRDALEDSIRSFTGVRPVIDDWFFIRFIVDEVLLGVEVLPGSDPWILYDTVFDIPGSPPFPMADGDVQVSIRAADEDGLVDHDLVEAICDLARPLGEYYEVAYVQFTDTMVDGRLGHWRTIAGAVDYFSGDSTVSPPVLPGFWLPSGTRYRMETPLSSLWDEYVWSNVVRWTADSVVTLGFYIQDSNNLYTVEFNTAAKSVTLRKIVAGVPALITAVVLVPELLATPAQRAIRIDVQETLGALNLIRVYLDGDLVLEDATDGTFVRGPAEYQCSGPTRVSIHRPELWTRPLSLVIVGP